VELTAKKINLIEQLARADPEGMIGATFPLKPTKVSIFAVIWYNTENNIKTNSE